MTAAGMGHNNPVGPWGGEGVPPWEREGERSCQGLDFPALAASLQVTGGVNLLYY